LFAGGMAKTNYVSTIDLYNRTSNQWSVFNLSIPRISVASTSVNSAALFAGGYDAEGQYLSIIDVYGDPNVQKNEITYPQQEPTSQQVETPATGSTLQYYWILVVLVCLVVLAVGSLVLHRYCSKKGNEPTYEAVEMDTKQSEPARVNQDGQTEINV